MPENKKRFFSILLIVLLFAAGGAGGYFYFSKRPDLREKDISTPQQEKEFGDFSFVRIYFPVEGRLVMEERRVKRQVSSLHIAEAVVGEFLKGPVNAKKPAVPQGTKLLTLYMGVDGILYIDFSDELRRNFQGDSLAELLLLKGLYESIIANVQGIDDVKIIVEGKETESIGGHLLALRPLKALLQEIKE